MRLLASEMDAREAAGLLAEDPETRAILVANAQALSLAAQPCGDHGVRKQMQRLFIQYGMPKKTPEEMPFWLAEYYAALSSLPMEAMEHAVSEYIRTAEIHMVPMPSVLVRLADQKAIEIGRIAYRAGLVAKLPAPKTVKRPTDEERAEAKALLADIKAGKFFKKPPEAQAPRESREAMSNRLKAALGNPGGTEEAI